MPTLVSACLLGVKCRYDGQAVAHEAVCHYARHHNLVPVCPEQLGGLPTPRTPAEIVGGDGHDVLDGKARVIDAEGNDVTQEYVHGAEAALHIARSVGADRAIFKTRSPSCGLGQIYDGTHSGILKSGVGVTSALLERNGIHVVTEEDTSLRSST